MRSWQKNTLGTIGKTSLIELQRIGKNSECRIFVKAEFLNPVGSIKIRPALRMIEEAEKLGILEPDSIIVEASSGNQGIALAMIGAIKEYGVA